MQSLGKVIKAKNKKYKVLSALERKIVDELLEYDGLDFESNYKVGFYFVDIAFPKHKVGLEIDGYEYHKSEEKQTKDLLRQEYLEQVRGWKIERVPGWFCYRNPEITVAKVLRHVPEVKNHPRFLQSCVNARRWFARELVNEGYMKNAMKILTNITI